MPYSYDESCLAVVGLAAKLPGASSLEEFWDNLMTGKVCRSRVPEKVLAKSIHAKLRSRAEYVPYRYTIDGYEYFDADFFDLSPREASVTDPQHRLVLEYSLRAFENAGYPPEDNGIVRTGVYASSDISCYLLSNLYPHLENGNIDVTESFVGNDKDYLATRIAYKFNFTGPAMTVQSACSSSLSSLHAASLALLGGECDRALVTSSTVMLPDIGYLYQPGGMRSSDGFCRPYDAAAGGTVFSNGVVAVLVKRLQDALADRDRVWGVIRSVTVNNDGGRKMGFVAPSAEGQATAIRAALKLAGVAPQDIAYVEGHGTATPMGDPIEVAALLSVFGEMQNGIILSSVKGNIGHLDSSSGLAGLLKACLALRNRVVPGTANFTRLNPAFGDMGPLRVSSQPTPLKRRDGIPLLAGVSAFGFGGTNVHVILQEAPNVPVRAVTSSSPELLLFSAPCAESLEKSLVEYGDLFSSSPDGSLADTAFTLAAGRRHYAVRCACATATFEEAADMLQTNSLKALSCSRTGLKPAFLFPGQGNLHTGAGTAYYANDSLFREKFDAAAELVRSSGGPDLIALLHAKGDAAEETLSHTGAVQPLLFALELAFAQSLIEQGVQPSCMAGHSLGEYAAAAVSGVFSFEDAVRLVTRRAALMQSAPPGRMMAVMTAANGLEKLLGGLYCEVELAVINSPSNCVLSGSEANLLRCRDVLKQNGTHSFFLATLSAFHSSSMDAVLEAYREVLLGTTFHEPRIPFVSNLTGQWAGGEVCTANYWLKHMRQPVLFAACMETIAAETLLAVEVGPGHTMRALALQQHGNPIQVVPGLDEPGLAGLGEAQPRRARDVLTELWLAGGAIDWNIHYAAREVRRLSLPGVVLHPRKCWIEPLALEHASSPHFGLVEETASTPPSELHDRQCSSAYVPPTGSLEQELAEIWQNLLFVNRIGVHDDFLELGGNSIQVMQLIKIAADKGLHFAPKDVFSGKTIAGLAERIRSNSAEQDAVPFSVPPSVEHWMHVGAGEHLYLLFQCPDEIDITGVKRLAADLAKRHDALRLVWDETGSRLANVGDAAWEESLAAVMDGFGISHPFAEPIVHLPAFVFPRSGLTNWRLALLPATDDCPRAQLLAVFSRAVADPLSLCVLSEEILNFFDSGLVPEESAFSWKSWAQRVNKKLESSAGRLVSAEWELLGERLSKAAKEGAAWSGKRVTGASVHVSCHIIQDPDLQQKLEKTAERYRLSTEAIACAAMAHALATGPCQAESILLWQAGRGRAGAVGSFGSLLPLLNTSPQTKSSDKAVTWFKDALFDLPGHGRGLWPEAAAGFSASALVEWMDLPSPSRWDVATEGRPGLQQCGLCSPCGWSAGPLTAAAAWFSGPNLVIRLSLHGADAQNRRDELVRSLHLALRRVSEEASQGGLPHDHPFDFSCSRLTRADLAQIQIDLQNAS